MHCASLVSHIVVFRPDRFREESGYPASETHILQLLCLRMFLRLAAMDPLMDDVTDKCLII